MRNIDWLLRYSGLRGIEGTPYIKEMHFSKDNNFILKLLHCGYAREFAFEHVLLESVLSLHTHAIW